MNIGIDARPLSYRLTGIGFYLKCLLDEIQRQDQTNYYFLISNGPIEYKLRNNKWSKIEGRFNQKLVSTFWLQCLAPILAQKYTLDLFWGTRHNLPILLNRRTKTVLTIHDMTSHLYPYTMDWANLVVELLLKRLSAIKSDKIIAVSNSAAADIAKYYKLTPEKINVIYSGIPVTSTTHQGSNLINNEFPSKYFLFVGTLEPRKNFRRIFKAFESIEPEKQDIYLVIIGGAGWKNKKFVKMLEAHPLREHVKITGYISDEKLSAAYQNALCLLFPSTYEGFGFPILEAMSFGVPVITSNRASMPEVAGDSALLVNPFSVHEITNAMIKIIHDDSLRKKLIQLGYKHIKKFSWAQCANDVVCLFEKMAGQ